MTKILIVEDEAITAMDIKHNLINFGFDVVGTADSGKKAIEIAQELKPDLILMDITLKGDMDGIEAARKIKTLFDIPVIYMSAFTDKNTHERLKLTNPYGFVSKPVSTELLVVSIEAAVYKHDLDKKLAESEERLRLIFDSSKDFIYSYDLEGRFTSANKHFCQATNLSEDEIKEVAHKYGRLVEVVIKPEIRITEIHDVRDIQAEAEIILKNGCVLEDIEYYLQGFHEPLKRKIHLQDISEMERFLKRLSEDSARMDALERLYTLSGGGIHSHRITGPDTKSLAQVEKELKKKGFLLGVNLSEEEIFEKIKEYGRVSEMLLHHAPGSIDDKTIILKHGGRILDSKHYLPGLEQVVTRKLYLKDYDDLKRCEEEYKKPDARRSLDTLSQISRNIHSHTVSAGDVKTIKKIIKALDESGQLLGVDLPEKEIWTIVENAEPAGFCVE